MRTNVVDIIVKLGDFRSSTDVVEVFCKTNGNTYRSTMLSKVFEEKDESIATKYAQEIAAISGCNYIVRRGCRLS